MPAPCEQKDNIKQIQERLGDGDVTLATIGMTLERIEEQVTTTNGRVTRLEKLRTIIFGILVGTALASTSGPGIVKAILAALK